MAYGKRVCTFILVMCFLGLSACQTHLYKRAELGQTEDGWRTIKVDSLTRHTKEDSIGVMYLRMADATIEQKKNIFVVRDMSGKSFDQYLVTYTYNVETNRDYTGKIYKLQAEFKPIAQKEFEDYLGMKVYDAHRIVEKYGYLRHEPGTS
ncbi:MAG: hypothetical protein OXT06_06900 [Rhodospirillaceae bacterium]|nr:hypothetical protein [Rhodospirillaceae bacterium]